MKKFVITLAAGILLLPSLIAEAAMTKTVTSPWTYSFTVPGTLAESSSLPQSSSPYWWVNSGAYMNLSKGEGSTVKGNLPENNYWRKLYAANNPTDTDNGYHPQNIFRLVSRQDNWKNIRQEAYYKITKDNLSASSNRNASNGLLLMSRYQDGMNLYYSGIRVDGAAVIKKKKGGTYTTLAYKSGVFPGTYSSSKSNLLPMNTWVGLRTEVKDMPNGSVSIKLYMDKGKTGNWTLVAEATDSSSPITGTGSVGIRTDFMDVSFDNFKVTNI